MNDRFAYPSDLTDAEWEVLEPLRRALCPDAAHVKYTRREIVNAIDRCPAEWVPVETASQ
jgi:transposase